MKRHRANWTRALFVPIALACLSCRISAQQVLQPQDENLVTIDNANVQVDLHVGFGGSAAFRLPVPISAAVTNKTKVPIDGVLELELRDVGSKRIIRQWTLPMYVSPGAKKIARLCVGMGNHQVIAARLKAGHAVLWQRAYDNFIDQPPTNINVLAIDAARRAPVIERVVTPPAATPTPLPTKGERPIHCVGARSWQLPTNAPPLFGYHAVVFSANCEPEALVPGQLEALVRYLISGGTVAVAGNQGDLRQRLIERLPEEIRTLADAQLAATEDASRAVTEIAAGRLVTMSPDCMQTAFTRSDVGFGARKFLAGVLESQPEIDFPKYIFRRPSYSPQLSENAAGSLEVVLIVFLCYTVVTGPAMFLLRKACRKTVLRYLVVCLVSFIGITLVTGIWVQNTAGDLESISVTELTPHGGVQWTFALLSSAGGRNHDLKIVANYPQAWLFMDNLAINRWRGNAASMDITDDTLFKEADDGLSRRIPIIPWGSNQALVHSYRPDMRSIQVSVTAVPAPANPNQSGVAPGNRQFKVMIKNTSPYNLRDVAVAIHSVDPRSNTYSYARVIKQTINIGNIAAGEAKTQRAQADTSQQFSSDAWGMQGFSNFSPALLRLPSLYTLEGCLGYLIAKVTVPGNVQFQSDDFTMHAEVHYVVQAIPPSEMPSYAELYGTLPTATPAPADGFF